MKGIVKALADGDALREGTWGAEIIDELKPKDGDKVVGGKRTLTYYSQTTTIPDHIFLKFFHDQVWRPMEIGSPTTKPSFAVSRTHIIVRLHALVRHKPEILNSICQLITG